jgi:hypothetical protein
LLPIVKAQERAPDFGFLERPFQEELIVSVVINERDRAHDLSRARCWR